MSQHPRFLVTFFLLLTVFNFYSGAQTDEYAKPFLMAFDDRIYVNHIHTLQLQVSGMDGSFPAIPLNGPDKLHLAFDDFHTDIETYYFSFIHCTYNWEPTEISASDYIEGFQEDQITDMRRSFNTVQPYIHYQIDFPTEHMKATKSGNYLLKVYKEGMQDEPVFTRKFILYESFIHIQADIHAATVIEERFTHQEVDLTLQTQDYRIDDVYKDFHLTILQNDDFNQPVTNLVPGFVRDNEIVYQEDEKNTFGGGKEYRWFNSANLREPNVRINKIRVDSTGITHLHLYNDDKRAFRKYATEQDINGRFTLKTSYGNDPGTDADYCWIHFYLMSDLPVIEGNVYVSGAFSFHKCLPAYKMVYNPEFKGYLGKAYLKQGFYNYRYQVLRNNDGKTDAGFTEGNRYETENEYVIIAYHQPIGVFYDRVIGLQRFSSTLSQQK